MGWFNYYRLLEKYQGDLSKATKLELKNAEIANPNDPFTALEIAKEKWRQAEIKKADDQAFLETFNGGNEL